jgi:tetratricopeptide (TPR) repeat protein
MAHALAHGIRAHRDLKPSNCLMVVPRVVAVSDFGSALSWTRGGQGGPGGTWEYMPPEQWTGAAEADERSDIYSFGVTFWEMLTGAPTFGRRSATRGRRDFERQHLHAAIPRLPSRVADLQPMLERCLAKNPSARFASFRDVRSALEACYQDMTGIGAPPAPPALNPPAEIVLNLGVALEELGDLPGALRHYDRAIDLAPDGATGWINKSSALRQLGQLDGALEAARTACRLAPADTEALLVLATVLDESDRPAEALNVLDSLLAIDETADGAWYSRGIVLERLIRPDEALASYRRAIELNPYHGRAHTNLGGILSRAGKFDEALRAFDRAIEVDPSIQEAWHNRGSVQRKRGTQP